MSSHAITSRRPVAVFRARLARLAAMFTRLALLVTVVTLATPAPAFAHAHLKSSSPAAGARLTAAPTQLVLTFSEAPALAVSVLRLLGPDSTPVTLGDLTHDAGATTITARITGALRAGRYTVLWQTAGDDGHVQHGSFQFTIADGASGLATAAAPRDTTHATVLAPPDTMTIRSTPVVVPPSSFEPSSPAYVVIRWVQFVALLLLIGAVAFRWWVLPRAGAALDDAARLEMAAGAAAAGLWGALFLGVTLLARLVAQVATMQGLAGASPSLDAMLIGTVWGHGWLLELMALIVANFALRVARRDVASLNAWRALAAAVAALAFVPALSGHAAAERTFVPFTMLFDAAHVLSAGAWLGGLAVMLAAGLPVMRRATSRGHAAAPATMVNAFSPLALTSAAILVFTGVVAARLHVAAWAAFTRTSYGRALLVKLALVVLLLAVATWNWRRARPRLATAPDTGAAALARSARVELALAVIVLLVTAVLVALPTPAGLALG